MKTNMKIRFAALFLCLVMLFVTSCSSEAPSTNIPSDSPSSTTTDNSTPDNGEGETPDSGEGETPDSGEGTTPDGSEGETPDEDEYPANGDLTIVTQNRTLYSSADNFSEVEFAHYELYPDILLIDIASACEGLLAPSLEGLVSFEFEETETTVRITRENGAYCELNFLEDSVYFSDYDMFFALPYSSNLADRIALPYVDEEGNSVYFSRENALGVTGLPLQIDLAERAIPLDIYKDVKYIPLQTFSDLFLSLYNISFTFNSEDVFLVTSGALDPSLVELYYSIGPKERSEALAHYTFNELCLMLDLCYGLQDEHGIKIGFTTYLESAGLYDDLLDSDPNKFANALASLTFGFLADRHSALKMPSPYTGSETYDKSNMTIDSSILHAIEARDLFKSEREKMMPDGVPGYHEIGNTAFVTFDEFSINAAARYGDYTEDSAAVNDTFSLIIYAHSMINRENSPIENVVLDLSCNGGGALDAAVYVVGWMLGYCDLHFTNPISNGYATISYKVDVNLDKVFDKNDTIADKNLYCIISPVSFSCGNLVPALLKESGMVTLIGETSGGGACVVQEATTADGSAFCFSSPYRLSVVSNGSYYTIDRGVDPHFRLTKTESYFDREALVAFINSLL